MRDATLRLFLFAGLGILTVGCECAVPVGHTGGDAGTSDASRTVRTDECGNGLDDDHNGLIDDGCFCGEGEMQDCFSGAYAGHGVGACRDGAQRCAPAVGVEWDDWSHFACEGEVLPGMQLCTGHDEDCDAAIDEGCPCTAGETRGCGLEFVLAPCTGGTQTCLPSGEWGGCEGAVLPMPDLCDDGIDNDCNGAPPVGCDCVDPEPEICRDGIDNDCDGDVDEITCSPDWPRDGGVPDAGTCVTEICDNRIDDDCDGLVDQGCASSCSCTTQWDAEVIRLGGAADAFAVSDAAPAHFWPEDRAEQLAVWVLQRPTAGTSDVHVTRFLSADRTVISERIAPELDAAAAPIVFPNGDGYAVMETSGTPVGFGDGVVRFVRLDGAGGYVDTSMTTVPELASTLREDVRVMAPDGAGGLHWLVGHCQNPAISRSSMELCGAPIHLRYLRIRPDLAFEPSIDLGILDGGLNFSPEIVQDIDGALVFDARSELWRVRPDGSFDRAVVFPAAGERIDTWTLRGEEILACALRGVSGATGSASVVCRSVDRTSFAVGPERIVVSGTAPIDGTSAALYGGAYEQWLAVAPTLCGYTFMLGVTGGAIWLHAATDLAVIGSERMANPAGAGPTSPTMPSVWPASTMLRWGTGFIGYARKFRSYSFEERWYAHPECVPGT